MRRREIDWVLRGGCQAIFPSAWEDFARGLSALELQDPLMAYYARLTSDNEHVRTTAASRMFRLQASLHLGSEKLQVWSGRKWDCHDVGCYKPKKPPAPHAGTIMNDLDQDDGFPAYQGAPNRCFPGFWLGDHGIQIAQQLLTCHYSVHDGYFGEEGLLSRIDRIRGIPAIAVHGRNDMVCPAVTAFELHKAWPELEVQMVPNGGHSMYDPRIRDSLMHAIQRMSLLGSVLA
jgi:proline iminopeptidase